MALGAGGGLAEGFASGFNTVDSYYYRQGLLNLENKRMQQDEQNKKRAEYMDLRKQAIEHLGDHITQMKIANPKLTDLQIANDPSVIGLRDRLSGFDKNLGLDPNEASSIVADYASRPSAAVTEGALARAKEGPLGQEQKLADINAKRRIAGQPLIDVSGNPAPPQNPDLDTETQLGGKQFKSTGNPKADNIIRGIDNGDLPPNMTGLYRNDRTDVMSGLEANGVKLAQRQLQWEQAKKQVASLNGPQMTRYAGLNESVINTIDEVNSIAKEMSLSGFPAANSAYLTQLIQTEGNSPNGQLAARYIGAVNTLKEEFANLANGGYAPTDPAWKLANQQINGNYGVKELGASLGEVQKLVKIRFNAIPGMKELGPNSANQYTGRGQKQDKDDPLGIR